MAAPVREQVSVCKACRRPFKRTGKQNRYIHAEPFLKLAKKWGESIARTKLICMGEFWGYEPVTVKGIRLLLPVQPHTSDMTVEETSLFLDWLIPWALEEHQVEIKSSDEWDGHAA